MAIWHMLQGFLGAFPQYAPNSTSVGVHLFAESYGGKYGPAFASLWEKQNLLRSNGTLSRNGTIDIKLASLGIVNGCVDDLIQGPFYPAMAINNTYGLQLINPTRAQYANGSFYASGGCRDRIVNCRAAVKSQDPSDEGDVKLVNTVCNDAYIFCQSNVIDIYADASRSYYDISHYLPESFPPKTYLEYLNSAEFQAAIGTPVNYTETNIQVVSAFTSTGDYEREALVPNIAALLNAGIRVGLIYGDRDYLCNWMGGEAISLAVAAQTSSAYATLFPAAGYAPIIVNTSYIGGVVRQYGNLSFSRIYDAGHSVPAYQPETAFQVFARIITGTSLSTGAVVNVATYNTSGTSNAIYSNVLPSSPAATCWLRDIPDTCSDDEKNMMQNGKGVIMNGVFYSAESDYSSVATSSTSTTAVGSAASVAVTTTTEVLTGFFTATSTPTATKKSFGSPSFSLSFNVLALSLLCTAALSFLL